MKLAEIRDKVKYLDSKWASDMEIDIIANLLFTLYYIYNLDIAENSNEVYKILLSNKEDLDKRSEGITIALKGDITLRQINLLAFMKNVFC